MTEFIERRKRPSCVLTPFTQWTVILWPLGMALYFLINARYLPAVFEGPLETYYRLVAIGGIPLSLVSVIWWRHPIFRKIAASVAFGRFISAAMPAMFVPPAVSSASFARVLLSGIMATFFVLFATLETPMVYEIARSRESHGK